jgi:ATP-binding cassette, subfamily B, multidrug efflux pump
MQAIRKLLPFVKPYWKRSLVSLLLLIAVVIMDLMIPRLVQRIIDQGIFAGNQPLVIETTLIMLTISLLSTIFAIGNNNLSVQVGESVARDLREALFLKIQSFSYGNLDQLKTGQLLVRLGSDATVFQRLVQVSLRIGTRAPLLMLGSLILMLDTDLSLALTMIPLVLVTSGVIVFFVSKMGGLFRTVQERLDRLNTVLQENIAGARVVKSFVRHEYEAERFAQANQDYTTLNIRVMQFMTVLSPLLSTLVNLGIVAVVWGGGAQAIRGDLTTGELIAFINYLQTTMGPLMISVMLANVWGLAWLRPSG